MASSSFGQLGQLVGSFMFWEEDPNDPQPQRLEKLMRWTLNLPHVRIGEENYYPRLGVSATGFAGIYFTILQAKKRRERSLSETQAADEETITNAFPSLKNPSASIQHEIAEPQNNYRHFEPHIDQFASYVKYLSNDVESTGMHHRSILPKMYIWLDREDIDWWLTAIRKTLEDYLGFIKENVLTLSEVAKRCDWLECSVFTPLDITKGLPIFVTAEDEAMSKQSAYMAEKVNQAAKSVYGTPGESHHLYLTWELFALDYWEDYWRKQLVHRTMLSLWTAWPWDMVWAPGPPDGYSPPSHSSSLEEATRLLTHLLTALRRYFLHVKDAHRLSLTKLEFGGLQTHYPPTFYFADPINLPSTAAGYVENTDVHQLISSCIEYDDPHADTLSWSSLEGSVASVRGETTQMGRYKTRYLLLPIEASPDNNKVIGSDLDYIVGLLTFLEYTIGLEAEDIYKRVKDIESKRVVDSDTLNTVDYISRKLANLVSTLPGEALKRGTEEFADLQLLLGRVQYGLEKMKGEAVLLERQYELLVNRTIEYLRNTMILAPILDHLPLSAALMDAYPYHYLRIPMKYVPVYTAQLANSNERLGALLEQLSRAINNENLNRSERQNRRIQQFGALIAAAALLVALPTFFPNVDVKAIFTLFGNQATYTSNTGIIALVILALSLLVLLVFLLWFCVRILQRMRAYFRFSKKRGRFREDVRKFWNLADYTTYMYDAEKKNKGGLSPLPPALYPPPPSWFKKRWDSGKGAEIIDNQATSVLQKLWSYLDSLSQATGTNKQHNWYDNQQQASENMLAQVRILSRLVHVFLLRPDRIPLPRALCVMRYKSLQFLEKPTIGDNEFRDSLTFAGFTPDQVNFLQDWLNESVNLKWIRNRDNSVAKVAKALGKKGITANPSEEVVNHWQGNLFSQDSRHSLPTN